MNRTRSLDGVTIRASLDREVWAIPRGRETVASWVMMAGVLLTLLSPVVSALSISAAVAILPAGWLLLFVGAVMFALSGRGTHEIVVTAAGVTVRGRFIPFERLRVEGDSRRLRFWNGEVAVALLTDLRRYQVRAIAAALSTRAGEARLQHRDGQGEEALAQLRGGVTGRGSATRVDP